MTSTAISSSATPTAPVVDDEVPHRTATAAAESIVDAMVMPQLIRLDENLYAARFTLMKLVPARFILDRAEGTGALLPGAPVVETSSGTFGLALAMLCALRRHLLTIVSDPVIDDALHRRLTDLGAAVEIVPEPAAVGGYQRARLDRVQQLLAADPRAFCPRQYDNPWNGEAYAEVATMLAASLPAVDCLVGTVGSGGSLCGTLGELRRRLRRSVVGVAVDTHGSVLFGQPDAGRRALRGLGNSLVPANLDATLVDEVHWVGAAEAFLATRRLHRRHAMFMGPTSGAAYMVASWLASRDRARTVLCMLPDDGHRYESTVYDDRWLRDAGLLAATLPEGPREVASPAAAGPEWSAMAWNRRSRAQVLQAMADAGAET